MFYQSKQHDLAIAQIPKAGLTTIKEWLGREFIVVPNNEVTVSRRVAFIRNPLERVKSHYSFRHWNRIGRGEGDESYEEYVDLVLSTDNEHWRRQSEHIGDTANIFHRFENLAKVYEAYKPGVLPWLNRSSRLPTNDYRYDDLVAFYREDQQIWDNC